MVLAIQWVLWVVPMHLLVAAPEPAGAATASHCAPAPIPVQAPQPAEDPACDLHCSALANATVAPLAGSSSPPSLTLHAPRSDAAAAAIPAGGSHPETSREPPASSRSLRTTVLRL